MYPKPARTGGKGVRSGGGAAGPGTAASGPAISGEFQVIAALQEQFEAVAGRNAPKGDLWIGDDAALVTDSGGAALLLATDLVVAGVHVDLDLCSLSDLGFKAIMVTVSDLAAMGARPDYLLVSIAAPSGTDFALLASGMAEAAADTGAVVVGGDLSTAPVVMVSVAVTGSVGPGLSSPGSSHEIRCSGGGQPVRDRAARRLGRRVATPVGGLCRIRARPRATRIRATRIRATRIRATRRASRIRDCRIAPGPSTSGCPLDRGRDQPAGRRHGSYRHLRRPGGRCAAPGRCLGSGRCPRCRARGHRGP